MTCPRCSVQLQEGFLLDRTRNDRSVGQWVEGKPERSFWTGVRLSGKTRLQVVAWRCPRCGLLELNAPAAGGTT